jgi:outer membrane protein
VQLKKHLVEGTDLSLRLDATRQTSSQFFLLPPGTATFGLMVDPDGTFEAHLGPGYGAALKLTATQPLLRGAGRNVGEADLRAARGQLTTAELSREEAASEVLRDALTAYWESWYANAAVEIERRARDAAQRQLDDATGRIRTGSLAPADGLTFETQVATRDEDVVRAESERSHRAAELARLLGAAQSPESVGVPPDGPPEPPEEQGDLRTEAIGASPALRVLASAVALASVQAETAGDALRPRLDLDGYLQAQGLAYDDVPAALRQLAKGEALSAHIGLTFELPLDDTQHRAQRDRALLAVDTAGHKLEEGRQQVLASLETLRQAEISARQRVALAGQTREFALRQASAEEARFTTGGSTAIQVLQAQDAVRTAELRVARARTDLAQAHLSVVHLVGRLLQEVTRPAESGACAIR